MKLDTQKRLAASILKVSSKKVSLDTTRLEEIKEAITKADIKSLIKDKAITSSKKRGISRGRIRKNNLQKGKGRRKGPGSKKGTLNAKVTKKRRWINLIRVQRGFLQNLRDKEVIDKSSYRDLYRKSKGGFFRSKRHLKMYMEEHSILKSKK